MKQSWRFLLVKCDITVGPSVTVVTAMTRKSLILLFSLKHQLFLLQPLAPPPPRFHGDDEDEDLNKAFDVQHFQEILNPAARHAPEKRRVYDEQDFEGQNLWGFQLVQNALELIWDGSKVYAVLQPRPPVVLWGLRRVKAPFPKG